jgi:DHA2 family multidrug resistance protein-like MFS transporter
MLTICLGVMLSGLDGIIVNVALPQISLHLHVAASDAVWIATAYQLAVIVSLLPWAAAGESVGYKQIYLIGMAIFLAGSAACALAPSLAALLAARAVQGVGGGAMVGVSLALVRCIYPRALLGRGVALYSMIAALSQTAGPSVAAAILAAASWPWLFAVNLPLGFAALAVGLRMLPKVAGEPRAFDVLGAVLTAVMFVCLVSGVDAFGAAPHLGRAFALLVAGAVAATVLVRHQKGQAAPLLPLDLLTRLPFTLSAATSVFAYAAQTAAYVGLPFMFEHDLGRTALQTGLLLTPWPLMQVFAGPVSGRLADRLPPGALTAVGMAGTTVGLILLWRLQPGASAFDIGWRLALCGLGNGLFQAPNNRALLMAAPPARTGAASGMVAVSRIFGMAMGAAVAAMTFNLFTVRGSYAAVLIAAGMAGAACVFSLLRSRRVAT